MKRAIFRAVEAYEVICPECGSLVENSRDGWSVWEATYAQHAADSNHTIRCQECSEDFQAEMPANAAAPVSWPEIPVVADGTLCEQRGKHDWYRRGDMKVCHQCGLETDNKAVRL